MTCWLYQMNAKKRYPLRHYRTEVWEGHLVTNWTIGEGPHKPKDVQPGDTVILFFVKAGTDEPGIYGWGVITAFHEKDEEIDFRPVPPSDYLKMNPVPEEEVSEVIRQIRGRVAQGTMWQIDDAELRCLRQSIAHHGYGISFSDSH